MIRGGGANRMLVEGRGNQAVGRGGGAREVGTTGC